MKKFWNRVHRTISDLKRRWGALGAAVIILVYILTTIAAGIAIFSFKFPSSTVTLQTKTVVIFLVVLLSVMILAIITFITLILRMENVGNTWYFRVGETPVEVTELILNPELGEMQHGGMRHVLFRLDTFKQILIAAFYTKNSLLENELERHNELRKVGAEMGRGFGEEFVEHLRREGLLGGQLIENLVKMWCDFDISGGWGKWNYIPDIDDFRGIITIKNNFLTNYDCKGTKGESSCMLLVGYIEGVLEWLALTVHPMSKWKATAKITGCSVGDNPRHKPCSFEYIIEQL